MKKNFHWIWWIQRIREITEAWIVFNLRISSITCVLMVQWYHSVSHTGDSGFKYSYPFNFFFFLFFFFFVQWKHLGKTPFGIPISIHVLLLRAQQVKVWMYWSCEHSFGGNKISSLGFASIANYWKLVSSLDFLKFNAKSIFQPNHLGFTRLME